VARPHNFRAGAHVVHLLHAHLVFIPKYRRRVLTQRVFDVLRATWVEVCGRLGAELVESNCEGDHVHLLLCYPPKVQLSALVQRLKGLSARRVRAKRFPEVTRVLRGPAFWSASYCVVSCGGAPLETIKRYVQGQAGAAADPPSGALPPRTPLPLRSGASAPVPRLEARKW
jgi:putative transposase